MNYRVFSDSELERAAYGNPDPLVVELLRRWTVTAKAFEATQNELDQLLGGNFTGKCPVCGS